MRKKKDICSAVKLFRFLNFQSHEFIELRRAFVLIQWLNTNYGKNDACARIQCMSSKQ